MNPCYPLQAEIISCYQAFTSPSKNICVSSFPGSKNTGPKFYITCLNFHKADLGKLHQCLSSEVVSGSPGLQSTASPTGSTSEVFVDWAGARSIHRYFCLQYCFLLSCFFVPGLPYIRQDCEFILY